MRLDRVQVIWLTLGAVVALGLVFALGVVVGRRAARFAEGQGQSPIADIDAAGAAHDELTFYHKLTTPRAETPRAGASPHVAKPEVAPHEAEPIAAAPVEAIEPATDAGPTEVEAAPAAHVEPEGERDDSALHRAMSEGAGRHGEYTIQVSSFQSHEEARAFAAKLERKGFKPFVVRADINGKGTWYRVRLGAFGNVADAQRAKGLLARADIPAWVLKAD